MTECAAARVRANTAQSRDLFGLAGAACAIVGLVLVWTARLSLGRNAYVSELGADGELTASQFRLALILVAIAGLCVFVSALRCNAQECNARGCGAEGIAWCIITASACFALAATVPCTKGCPFPVGERFSLQDLVHTSVAVAGFALAAIAMLLAWWINRSNSIGCVSLVASISVAVVAGAGGILSLARMGTDFGSWCELIATSMALAWLAYYGVSRLKTTQRDFDNREPD